MYYGKTLDPACAWEEAEVGVCWGQVASYDKTGQGYGEGLIEITISYFIQPCLYKYTEW